MKTSPCQRPTNGHKVVRGDIAMQDVPNLDANNAADVNGVEARLRLVLERERLLNELRSRFVLTMSHELRTPLAVIYAAAQMLEHDRERLNEQNAISKLHQIQEQVKRLTGLLNDTLDALRTDTIADGFHPTRFDLKTLCHDLIDAAQTAANENVQIDFDCQCEALDVWMDKTLIQQIISNLLSNAVKYSPVDGRVCCILKCDADVMTICVQDNGIGIPKLHRERLFETFQRANNVGSIPGFGLGLFIVQRAVVAHRGDIIIDSEEGVGTTITVTIPITPH